MERDAVHFMLIQNRQLNVLCLFLFADFASFKLKVLSCTCCSLFSCIYGYCDLMHCPPVHAQPFLSAGIPVLGWTLAVTMVCPTKVSGGAWGQEGSRTSRRWVLEESS